MSEDTWEEVDVVNGEIQAELIRGLLEAQGLTVLLSQEGAGRALGLSVGLMGETQVLVPSSQKEAALQILKEYYSGELMDEEQENTGNEGAGNGEGKEIQD
jgi:Putative prokaryotic signal transducing protein